MQKDSETSTSARILRHKQTRVVGTTYSKSRGDHEKDQDLEVDDPKRIS